MKYKYLLFLPSLVVVIIIIITATVALNWQQIYIDFIRKDYLAKYPTTSYSIRLRETVPWGIDRKQLQLIMSESSQSLISESIESLFYEDSFLRSVTNEFFFDDSGKFYKVIYKRTEPSGDELFFIYGMHELLGKGFALNLDKGDLYGGESDLISGEINYAFTWVEDDQIKKLEHCQSKIISGNLFVNESLDKKHEFNELASKYQHDRSFIRFLSITSTMTLIDGLFIEMTYISSEIVGEHSVLMATFTNTLMQDS